MTPIPNDSHSCPSRPVCYMTNSSHRKLMIASTSHRDIWSFRRCRHHIFHNRDHCNALGGWWFLNRCFIDENPVFQVNCEISYQAIRLMIAVFWLGVMWHHCNLDTYTCVWYTYMLGLFDAHTFVTFHLDVSQTLEVLDFPCAKSRETVNFCFRFVVKPISGIPEKNQRKLHLAQDTVNSKW